jgi:hypothetical protein
MEQIFHIGRDVMNANASPDGVDMIIDAIQRIGSKISDDLSCVWTVLNPITERLKYIAKSKGFDVEELYSTAINVITRLNIGFKVSNLVANTVRDVLTMIRTVNDVAKEVGQAIKQKSAITEAHQARAVKQVNVMKKALFDLSSTLSEIKETMTAAGMLAPRFVLIVDNGIRVLSFLANACDTIGSEISSIGITQISLLETSQGKKSLLQSHDGHFLRSDTVLINNEPILEAQTALIEELNQKVDNLETTLVTETSMIRGKLAGINVNRGSSVVSEKQKTTNRENFKKN